MNPPTKNARQALRPKMIPFTQNAGQTHRIAHKIGTATMGGAAKTIPQSTETSAVTTSSERMVNCMGLPCGETRREPTDRLNSEYVGRSRQDETNSCIA